MKRLVLVAILMVGAMMLGGCSLTGSQSASSPSQEGTPGGMGRYYDFDDIQVPSAMKLDKDKSMVFKVGSFKAGLLTFSENLELESLVNFFVESMAKDNWVLKGSFKYPRVALFFAKQGKTCIIRITESTMSTEAEIWVAPSM